MDDVVDITDFRKSSLIKNLPRRVGHVSWFLAGERRYSYTKKD